MNKTELMEAMLDSIDTVVRARLEGLSLVRKVRGTVMSTKEGVYQLQTAMGVISARALDDKVYEVGDRVYCLSSEDNTLPVILGRI